MSGPDAPVHYDAWRHRFALATVAAIQLLIFVGGLVTSHDAGLAVPDWPLSYGMVMPPMVGNVYYEHGHRMAAAAVGCLTLVLAVWTARREPRRWARRLAWGGLAAVVAQGLLGGLTVLLLLPAPVSVAHACLAQTFFCMMIALAYGTSREWLAGRADAPDASGLRGAAVLATGVVYVQLVLGAVMRHIGAALAIPDFPLALGRVVPPFESAGVAVHFAHRVGATIVLACAVNLFLRARRLEDPRLRQPGSAILVLVLVQASLGALTVLSGRAVLPATAHVAFGAAVLGSCWFLTLRAARLLAPRSAEEPLPALPARA